MKLVQFIFVCILVSSSVLLVSAFDMKLDTQKDQRRWNIRGNYLYMENIQPGSRLAPNLVESSETTPAKGIWYFNYGPLSYENDNSFEISYTLKHQLFRQVWVKYLAHPDVFLVMKAGNNDIYGSFQSTGTEWCDVILDVYPSHSVRATVQLTNPGTYAMIDKIVYGVNDNITSLNNNAELTLNPCREAPKLVPQPLMQTTAATLVENPNHVEKERTTTAETTTSSPVSGNTNSSSTRNEPLGTSQFFLPTITTSSTNVTNLLENTKCQCSCSCLHAE